MTDSVTTSKIFGFHGTTPGDLISKQERKSKKEMPNHLCCIIYLDEYESIDDEADVLCQKIHQSLNQ